MKLRLREILKERGMTLSQFAEISGINQPSLSNYINGHISPTLAMMVRMAESLKISVTELLEEPTKLEIFVKYKGALHQITANELISLIEAKSDPNR